MRRKKMKRISPEEAQEMLRKEGVKISLGEAEEMLDFLRKLASIVVSNYLNHGKNS
ncbi:hypothetical protein [Sinomicrobium oceani]|uniref:hypothetical protein n=1 Tax=Sinomicrobium oceani TaxID=1150368 RepID=UPI00227C082A|nr:hypothetical protein [Sinomicrobium oceani]